MLERYSKIGDHLLSLEMLEVDEVLSSFTASKEVHMLLNSLRKPHSVANVMQTGELTTVQFYTIFDTVLKNGCDMTDKL